MKPLFFLLYFVTLLFIGCHSPARLYTQFEKDKFVVGELQQDIYTEVKQFLSTKTSNSVKDTIILKYDYNHETCWDRLDQMDDDYIKGFQKSFDEREKNILLTRPNVTFFNFREPGGRLNKIIKWNTAIKIDSANFLLKKLFSQRCTCGNSIIIMPDKKYIIIRSDSHSEAVKMSSKRISELLHMK